MTLDKIVRNPAIVLGILIVLVIVFLIYTYYSKQEGFENFREQQNKYTLSQRSEFWDNLNLQVDYNSDLEKDVQKGLNDALKSIDPMTNKTKKNDFSSFFRKDPIPGINSANQQCSRATEPYLLPRHDKSSPSGCGWWYLDDDSLLSFASKGTETGPFSDLNTTNPKGLWIWDLDAAQKLEDVKRCRRIKTCDMSDLLAEKCGFCNVLNIGIPAEKNGRSKYPEDTKHSCPEPLIMSPQKCPKFVQTPTVVTLPDGTVTIAADPPEICDPVNGKLSAECLISLAKGAGCNNSSVIISIIKGDPKGYLTGVGESGFKYNKSLEILKRGATLEVQPAFLGNGVCERSDALDFYQKLVNLILRGKTTLVREAASFLALGTDYDPCDYDPNELGPFDDYCLERVAREEGCQPDGLDFPTKPANKRRFYAMDWKSVNTHFNTLHGNLLSKDQGILYDASMKCLGVQVVPTVSECGDKRGVELLWYKWEYEWDMPDRDQSAQTFYGRDIKANMPSFDTAGADYNPWSVKDGMSFHARTRLITKKQIAGRMWSMTGGGLAIKLNDKSVLKTWREQGPTAYTTESYILSEAAPNKLDVFWFKGFGNSIFLPKISNPDDITQYLGITASDLNLAVPDTFPLCRWDLYMETTDDRNNVLTSRPENIRMGILDGKKCAMLGNLAGINIANQIMGTAFKSFTFMVYNKGGWARLFALRSGSCSMSDWNGWSIEGGLCSDSRAWFCLQSKGGKQDIYLSTGRQTVPMNKWAHIAFSIDDDFRGITIYCDSVLIGRKRNEIMNPSDYTETKYNIATIGHAGWNCSKTISPPPSADGVVPVKPAPVGPPQCLGLGRPNSDASIRLYNQSECDQLNGNFHGNGECYKKEGGSWSWECRELNKADTMTILDATYGGNCANGNTLKGNRTELFKGLADGRSSLKYVYDYLTTGGDPSGGCPKTLEITYSCGQDKKKLTVNAEAGFNGNVEIGCGSQYNNLALKPLPPSDCPPSKDGALNIGLAWVHWFDYTLTTKEIRNDMILAYTDETVYKEDPKSGWKKGK